MIGGHFRILAEDRLCFGLIDIRSRSTSALLCALGKDSNSSASVSGTAPCRSANRASKVGNCFSVALSPWRLSAHQNAPTAAPPIHQQFHRRQPAPPGALPRAESLRKPPRRPSDNPITTSTIVSPTSVRTARMAHLTQAEPDRHRGEKDSSGCPAKPGNQSCKYPLCDNWPDETTGPTHTDEPVQARQRSLRRFGRVLLVLPARDGGRHRPHT